MALVTDRADHHGEELAQDTAAAAPADAKTVFYELPEGMIDLPSAARLYEIPRRTLQTWVNTGRLPCYGRLRAPAPGGGYLVLDESEIVAYMEAPKDKGGRPRKISPTT